MKNWELIDVEESAKKYPGQFFIPSLKKRKSQSVGDMVQLHFRLNEVGEGLPRAERMWIEISEVSADGEDYFGFLTNQPKYIRGLNAGDLINFQAANIGQVIVKETDPDWIACGEQVALVSRKCFDQGMYARFIYCEEPDREEDSGWRILSGTESDEEMEDPNTIRMCNVYWLLDWDPTLFAIIKDGTPGDVFEREEKSQNWKRVEDWNSPE